MGEKTWWHMFEAQLFSCGLDLGDPIFRELIGLVWLDFFFHGSDHKGTALYQLQ